MNYVDMLLGYTPLDGEKLKKRSENEDIVCLLLYFCGIYNRYKTDITLFNLINSHGLKCYLKPDFLWESEKKVIEVDGLFTHYPKSLFPNPNTIVRYGSEKSTPKSFKWRGKTYVGNYIPVGIIQKKDELKIKTYIDNGFSVLKICESELSFLYINGGAARILNSETSSEIIAIFENFENNKKFKRLINKIKWFTEKW